MSKAAQKILTTINAPYGANLSAHQLAEKLVSQDSVTTFDASVFSFFSEVSVSLQEEFIADMGVNLAAVHGIAHAFAEKSGFQLALAA